MTTELQKYKNEDNAIDLEDAPVLSEVVDRLDRMAIHKFRTEATYPEFKMIVDLCYKQMVHSQHWKRNRCDLEISGILQVADEALSLLVLENNYKEWIEIANGRSVEKHERLTKYTNKGLRHNGTKKGWSLEGLKRFNTIFNTLKLERNKETSKERENMLMQEWSAGRKGDGYYADSEMPDLASAQEETVISASDFDYE